MTTDYNSEQNIITKECIFTALMLLIETKRFQDISITEITNKAGVSRMAYYRNYSCKEDIIMFYLDALFDEFFSKLKEAEKFGQYQVSYLYFDYCRQQEKIVKNLIKSNITYLLEDKISQILPLIIEKDQARKIIESENMKYTVEFIAGGLYRLTVQWIRGGLKESSEEMAKMLSDIIQ